MKRLLPALFGVAALVAILTRAQWLPLLAPWLPGYGAQVAYLGYVEGETLLIGPTTAGRVVARPVQRGQTVAAGAALFSIDPATARAQFAQAEAALAQARAQLADQLTGRRPPEQDVTRAQLVQAEASEQLAARELARNAELVRTAAVSRSQFDAARSQWQQAAGHVAELKAQLEVGGLPARPEAIAAARAAVAASQAASTQARVLLEQLSPTAPVAGLVQDTFYDLGEYVPAGQPVLALLPPDHVKLRFFVPEADIALMHPGTQIAYRCDGCSPGRTAIISYVAPQAEYTPPVIYSQTARAKLVFLVEARPDGGASALRPGLPVEVAPLAATP
jgi:HlyD family secretion protein